MKNILPIIFFFLVYTSLAQQTQQALLKEGIAYANDGEYQKAINSFNTALKSGPTCTKTLLHRGQSFVELGNYDAAAVDFERVISLDKKNAKAYFLRGKEKHRKNNLKGAIEDYNLALKYRLFDDEELFYLMARAKVSLEDYEGAIKDLDYLLGLNPFHQPAYLIRGLAWRNLKDYKGAISDFNKAIKIDPNCPTGYIQRGIARVELNRDKEALEDFAKAATLDQVGEEALYYRGLAKYRTGDNEGALDDLFESKRKGYLEAVKTIKVINSMEEMTAKSR